jgi:hypothetical protein
MSKSRISVPPGPRRSQRPLPLAGNLGPDLFPQAESTEFEMPLASPIASHPQVKELIVTPYCQFFAAARCGGLSSLTL